jgi:hypothetical protein
MAGCGEKQNIQEIQQQARGALDCSLLIDVQDLRKFCGDRALFTLLASGISFTVATSLFLSAVTSQLCHLAFRL